MSASARCGSLPPSCSAKAAASGVNPCRASCRCRSTSGARWCIREISISPSAAASLSRKICRVVGVEM